MKSGVENPNALTERILGACIEIHRALGPGLLESAYEECLCYELVLADIPFERQMTLPVAYKGVQLECGYRLDLLVEKTVVVEIKSIERILPVHEAQLLTYLRLTGVNVGLLVNFHSSVLMNGVKRMVNNFDDNTTAQDEPRSRRGAESRRMSWKTHF